MKILTTSHLERTFSRITQNSSELTHLFFRCILWSPPSPEEFKVDHNQYLDIAEIPPEEEAEMEEQIIL